MQTGNLSHSKRLRTSVWKLPNNTFAHHLLLSVQQATPKASASLCVSKLNSPLPRYQGPIASALAYLSPPYLPQYRRYPSQRPTPSPRRNVSSSSSYKSAMHPKSPPIFVAIQ
ncbi:hypothetical protein GYMLUDRAFT_393353 [Collybiopsis luxurians FD-317 M1]|uniref:Uncharacterized protein n=1 Tax=Collybiopsis luxurians FD-317 M1 TaxID=944289 RepID=A0A0D0BPM5_9AGAR|nr:hypothetical protein GYMLUDRAFT_393353 [Collybiopsis luxurians FD-317 M1]